MSNRLFVVLKPDCIRRQVWRDIIHRLHQGFAHVEMRLFCPTPGELLTIYPSFAWQHDYFEDWIREYRAQISLLISFESGGADFEMLGAMKGATFEPGPQSIRGCYGSGHRVSNLLHTPATPEENAVLEDIARRRRRISLDEFMGLESFRQSEIYRLGLLQWVQYIEKIHDFTGQNPLVTDILTKIRQCEPGSLEAQKLASNLEVLCTCLGFPLGDLEYSLIRQRICYPSSIPVAYCAADM